MNCYWQLLDKRKTMFLLSWVVFKTVALLLFCIFERNIIYYIINIFKRILVNFSMPCIHNFSPIGFVYIWCHRHFSLESSWQIISKHFDRVRYILNIIAAYTIDTYLHCDKHDTIVICSCMWHQTTMHTMWNR